MTLPYRRALITGISGQDGALLAAQLLHAGVTVVGTHRPQSDPSSAHFWRLRELAIDTHPALSLCPLDPLDAGECGAIVAEAEADALFHFAGQSSVAAS